ncbi:hypothetical protein PRJ_4164 [Pseudomonas sp. XWY-1]|nr:hypothetical protein PRJ_4164 [Pseudomonas sp. XWY-1]
MSTLDQACRSGFTREYGSSGNGDRRVEIGQQALPSRSGSPPVANRLERATLQAVSG